MPITYSIWIPLEIIFYGIVAYYSQKNNHQKKNRFLAMVIILSLVPLWAFIAPDSKNLAFDGLLYDIIMILTLTAGLVLFGDKSKFNYYNWLGIILVVSGFILMKL